MECTMKFKSDYQKLKYSHTILKAKYKEKIKEMEKSKTMIKLLKYNINNLEDKIKLLNDKNQHLSLLLDTCMKEMRSLKNGKTKDNK